MERASRVQLQQHTNGAQPSVAGRVESRPSAHGPGRPQCGQVGGPRRATDIPNPNLREALNKPVPNLSSLPNVSTESSLTPKSSKTSSSSLQMTQHNSHSARNKLAETPKNITNSSESTFTHKPFALSARNKNRARVNETMGSSRSITYPKTTGSLQNVAKNTSSLRDTGKTRSHNNMGPRIRFEMSSDVRNND